VNPSVREGAAVTAHVAELTERIDKVIEPFRDVVSLLRTVPGVSDRGAVAILAEIGPEMSRFPTAAHLASWSGICPGHHQSAGRLGSTSTRPGNAHLQAALGNAAMGAARTKGCYLQFRYRRHASRSTALKGLVATEHAIITSIWHMLSTAAPYNDLGADYYHRRDPENTKRRIIRQANDIGLTVRFDPIEHAGVTNRGTYGSFSCPPPRTRPGSGVGSGGGRAIKRACGTGGAGHPCEKPFRVVSRASRC
jgi:transposase